jgi:ribose transport system substrate-binding protein
MKKVLAILVAMTLILGAVACKAEPEATQVEPEATQEQVVAPEATVEEPGLVGISVPAADHGWVAAVAFHAESAAKELGLNYKLVTSKDPNEQAGQLQELIDMGCKVIVLFPHNDEVTVAAQKVIDAGIALVNFDRKVNVESTCYLAGDNAGIGVNGAEYIATKLGGAGKVIIAGVPAYGSINTERIDGFKNTIAEKYPNIEILNEYGATTSSQEDGLKLMTDILTANPQIDGVFSIDDELSIGLYKAVQEAGRTDVKVITGGGGAQNYFNLMQEVDDVWLASALYNPAMIKECVKIAKDILDGATPDKQIIIPASIVDRDNVADYLNPDSPY